MSRRGVRHYGDGPVGAGDDDHWAAFTFLAGRSPAPKGVKPPDKVLEVIESMRANTVDNYIVPGLTSHLVGTTSGTVRLFESSREQQEFITPHSHRYDFACLVLRGEVAQTTWHALGNHTGDPFQISELTYSGLGKYTKRAVGAARYQPITTRHTAGSWYRMSKDEIHSIKFSRGAAVLFFEGPSQSDVTVVLEPIVNGKAVPTFKTEDWMFKP